MIEGEREEGEKERERKEGGIQSKLGVIEALFKQSHQIHNATIK